jgi:hypothetical protein
MNRWTIIVQTNSDDIVVGYQEIAIALKTAGIGIVNIQLKRED